MVWLHQVAGHLCEIHIAESLKTSVTIGKIAC